jgi:hypothetical protein
MNYQMVLVFMIMLNIYNKITVQIYQLYTLLYQVENMMSLMI